MKKLLSLVLAFSAFAPSARSSEMIEVLPRSQRTLIVVTPGALEKVLATAPEHAVGQNAWASVSLQLGNFVGLRAKFMPYRGEKMSVAIEGFYGLGATAETSIRETYGVGARASFTVASDHVNDALLISPGVDVYFMDGTPGHGLAEYNAYGNVFFLAANAEITYVHEFAKHFGFEVGARLGAAIAVASGKDHEGQTIRGTLAPELGLFTGMRF